MAGSGVMFDFCAYITSRRSLLRDIRAAMALVAAHDCALGKNVEWRCDPLPGGFFQLHVSWPCADEERLAA